LLCKIRLSTRNPKKVIEKSGSETTLDEPLSGGLPVIEFNDNKAGGKGKQKLIIGEQGKLLNSVLIDFKVITFLFQNVEILDT
jgi:hypothetical protein